MNSSVIPNLFLIGAPKSGTTALANCLTQHSQVYCKQKEPRYFDAHTYFDDALDYPYGTLEEYLDLYDNVDAKQRRYRLDASVFNMYSEKSLDRIDSLSPDARYIVVLRDPLTASKSMFKQRLKYISPEMREVSDDFAYCWGLLSERRNGSGFPYHCKNRILFQYDKLFHYERIIPYFLENIDKRQRLLLRYEDYLYNPDKFVGVVFDWLGLSTECEHIDNAIVNPSHVLSRSIINRALEFTRVATITVRERIGLTGKKISWLKTSFQKVRLAHAMEIGTECDDDIRREFAETYDYLTKLEAEGSITKV